MVKKGYWLFTFGEQSYHYYHAIYVGWILVTPTLVQVVWCMPSEFGILLLCLIMGFHFIQARKAKLVIQKSLEYKPLYVETRRGTVIVRLVWAQGYSSNIQKRNNRLVLVAAHSIGHVVAIEIMSKVAILLTHIIKSGEPTFSMLVLRFLLGESFMVSMSLSFLPIVGGYVVAVVIRLNFNVTSSRTLISNLVIVLLPLTSFNSRLWATRFRRPHLK